MKVKTLTTLHFNNAPLNVQRTTEMDNLWDAVYAARREGKKDDPAKIQRIMHLAIQQLDYAIKQSVNTRRH